MPQPTNSDVHVDQALTNISIAFMQDESNYIANSVFPSVPSSKQSDKYFVYDRNDFQRDEAKKRAAGTESAGGGFDISTETFYCDVWAFHDDVAWQTEGNADVPIDLETDAAEFTTEKLLIRREREFVSTYLATSVWGTDKVGSTDFVQWNNESSSDPIEDIKDGRIELAKTGFQANTMTVGFAVHEALKKHPLILDRFKHTSSDSITTEMLARLFEVDRYLVARSVYATNEEGATAAYDFTVGDVCLLTHSAPRPAIKRPSAGYTFHWTNFTKGGSEGLRTNRIEVPLKQATRIESEISFDFKVVSTDLGYFFSDCLA